MATRSAPVWLRRASCWTHIFSRIACIGAPVLMAADVAFLAIASNLAVNFLATLFRTLSGGQP